MKNIINEFKQFAIKGNALELAIAVVIGAAFTNIVNSIVNDLINPLISLITGRFDFSNRFLVLNATSAESYATVAEAKAAGVATLNYGIFINNVIQFFIVSFIIFLIVRWINKLRRHGEADQGATQSQN
jgi:large conductance mechanosensitive channel